MAGTFRIARSTVSAVEVVVVEIGDGLHVGRGECRPYPRYDETPDGVAAQARGMLEGLPGDAAPSDALEAFARALPGGAAANAVASAVLDLLCKRDGVRAWERLGVPAPQPSTTAYTLSVDTPDRMAAAARAARGFPLLKVKVGANAPTDCVRAVVAARPDARLVVDANEALDGPGLLQLVAACAGADVALIEQPLPAGHALPALPADAPPICADESLHGDADLAALVRAGFGAVNVKLDKAGGPWAARDLMRDARAQGLVVMAGCMVGTSLAMAPMVALGGLADVLDLDGPLLLARDRENGLRYDGARVGVPSRALWG